MENQKTNMIALIVCAVLMCNVLVWGYFEGEELTIGDKYQSGTAPYFFVTMDAAGYSDWIYYGQSPEHGYGYHEILSGEYGAAVYYNGINTEIIDPNTGDCQAMWLTQDFIYPDWNTNSNFMFGGICQEWQDPNNPTPLYDTGQSVILNDRLKVRVDYEVVDLEFRDPNIYLVRSPMNFIDELTSQPKVMYSDRYCFLQTYMKTLIRVIRQLLILNFIFFFTVTEQMNTQDWLIRRIPIWHRKTLWNTTHHSIQSIQPGISGMI